MSSISMPGAGPQGYERISAEQKPSFRETLGENNAFYNQPDYLQVTKQDLSQVGLLPTTYTCNSESKVYTFAKTFFSIVIFPVALYHLFHSLIGKVAMLPASSPTLMGRPVTHANDSRSNISLNGEWKCKRLTIEVDGYKIDAMIFGKESTLNNGRWILASNGNGTFYEDKLLHQSDVKQIMSKVHGNAIVFNYPGVGASTGLPHRRAMAKSYRAVLSFLEDRKNGIGAKEIIGYGHSIGGGVQGDALKTHELKKDVKYVFVKGRTFSDLSTEASMLTFRILGFLVKLFGWNMDSVASSKKLNAPEIIMQTANVRSYEILKDSSKIRNDGVIPAAASLAKALLDDGDCPKNNKLFVGMSENHHDGFKDVSFLAQKIDELLKA